MNYEMHAASQNLSTPSLLICPLSSISKLNGYDKSACIGMGTYMGACAWQFFKNVNDDFMFSLYSPCKCKRIYFIM